jgi:hypothetical protein
LIWESSFNASDSIIAAQVMSRGEICYLGLRNSQKLMFIRTGPDNKLVIEKEIVLPDMPVKVTKMIRGSQNQLIAVFTFDQYQTLNWINTANGEISTSARIPGGFRVDEILTDRNNNLLLVACQGEIIVVRNNGIAF